MSYNLKFEWFVNLVKDKPSTITKIAVFILAVGLILEVCIPNSDPFMRSGSLLVCLAIFSVYVNHFVVKEVDTHKFINSLLDNRVGTGPSFPPEFGTERIAELNNQIRQMERQQHQESTRAISDLSTVKESIVKSEFLTGVIGTFIWGFGDIIVQPLSGLIKFIVCFF